MSHLNGQERARYTRALFRRVAERYDLMNRLISFGQDRRWRREAAQRLAPQAGEFVLDLGAGSGDLSLHLSYAEPDATVVAADFTSEMIQQGQRRPAEVQPIWVIADALHLPFPEGAFSGVASGFLLRNVGDLQRALQEQARVVASGGRVVSLETSPPPESWLRPFLLLQFRVVIPLLGALLTRDRTAYRYLAASTEGFLDPQQLTGHFEQAGFEAVKFTRRMLGTIAIHWARKP